ncbi:biotinidase [Acrasis kona]|uniref:Biotinidase n=1 Tax=Acrasis kona TaxID=1008807 RepID=A0AAW2ZGG4_9EUKA
MSGGFSGEVHTVFSYQGSKFDLESKNPNLLVAYIGCSPVTEQVEKYIGSVYGPKIAITHDPKATAPSDESLDLQQRKNEDAVQFVPKPAVQRLVFPELPAFTPKLRTDIDEKVEAILERTNEADYPYTEDSKKNLLIKAEDLLYKLYDNQSSSASHASKVLQQVLDEYRSISRDNNPKSRRRVRQHLVLESLIEKYSSQLGL